MLQFVYVNNMIQSNFRQQPMLIANVCELDELPFLKRPKYKWTWDEEEGERPKIRLLQNIRSLTFQCSDLMSKIFVFQKQVKTDSSKQGQNSSQNRQQVLFEQLLVTTEKQIIPLQRFFYLINDLLSHEEFSRTVSDINQFVSQCKSYIKDVMCSGFEIDFGGKEFLSFGIYLKKQFPDSLNFNKTDEKSLVEKFIKNNKFYVKCAVTNFSFEPYKDISQTKTKKPQPFILQNTTIIQKLFNIYRQLTTIPLSIKAKQIKNYLSLFDTIFHIHDEEYLKLQVFKNYPLLRSKFFLPIRFQDPITGEKLDGPIFSNSDPDCMFSHFLGYNADTIRVLEGNNCQQCRSYFEGVQQNPILTHLRDNLFNPYKTDVLFCPQFNRFKLIMKVELDKSSIIEEGEQKLNEFRTQIKYLNYLHLRSNLRKVSTKRRNKFNDMLGHQKFRLSFEFWGRRMLIMDPARGKNCSHYEFTDLRLFYLNKVSQNSFRCPICNDLVSDNDILYLKQVEILLRYLKFKCSRSKQLAISGSCFINHLEGKVFLEYKKKGKEGIVENVIEEMRNFYETLIDPYVSFNEYSLGIPDKYQQKLKEKYLFGFDKPNQEKDSDEQFEFKQFGTGQFTTQIQMPNKKVISSEDLSEE